MTGRMAGLCFGRPRAMIALDSPAQKVAAFGVLSRVSPGPNRSLHSYRGREGEQ
jgi:hypothetical protein